MTPTELYNKFKELDKAGRLPDTIRLFKLEDDIFSFLHADANWFNSNRWTIRINENDINGCHSHGNEKTLFSFQLKEPIKTMNTIKFAYTKELKEHCDRLHLALHGKKCKSKLDDQYIWSIEVTDGKVIYKCPRIFGDYAYNAGYISVEGNQTYFKGELDMILIDEEQEKALERIKAIEKELKELKEFVGKK